MTGPPVVRPQQQPLASGGALAAALPTPLWVEVLAFSASPATWQHLLPVCVAVRSAAASRVRALDACSGACRCRSLCTRFAAQCMARSGAAEPALVGPARTLTLEPVNEELREMRSHFGSVWTSRGPAPRVASVTVRLPRCIQGRRLCVAIGLACSPNAQEFLDFVATDMANELAPAWAFEMLHDPAGAASWMGSWLLGDLGFPREVLDDAMPSNAELRLTFALGRNHARVFCRRLCLSAIDLPADVRPMTFGDCYFHLALYRDRPRRVGRTLFGASAAPLTTHLWEGHGMRGLALPHNVGRMARGGAQRPGPPKLDRLCSEVLSELLSYALSVQGFGPVAAVSRGMRVAAQALTSPLALAPCACRRLCTNQVLQAICPLAGPDRVCLTPCPSCSWSPTTANGPDSSSSRTAPSCSPRPCAPAAWRAL